MNFTANEHNWPEIYSNLLPSLKQISKHQPCPICGGKDRFRLFKDWPQTGGAICNQCGAGNGVSWVRKALNCSFQTAINYLANNSIHTANTSAHHCRRLPSSNLANDSIRHKEAAFRLTKIWREASPAQNDHPYLLRKNISAIGVKQINNNILVPLSDTSNNLWNIQTIRPNGSKRFEKDARIKGCFYLLGDIDNTESIYIAEGFATASSFYDHLPQTNKAVVAAMSGWNLKNVAIELRLKYPNIPITIVSDDDRFTNHNPGRKYANEAAKSVGGMLYVPQFCNRCKGTDYNDFVNCSNCSSKGGC